MGHGDSEFVEARFLVDPKAEGDPVVAGKSKEFTYTADWLNFDKSVTGLPGVEVLLRLDEKSYVPLRDGLVDQLEVIILRLLNKTIAGYNNASRK